MIEKYASGILHPSEVYAQFKSLDIFDQDAFLQILLDDEDVILRNTDFRNSII